MPAERSALLPTLARISQAAFSRPPWNLVGDHEQRLAGMLTYQAALFLACEPDVIGFAVGTILCPASIAAYGCPEGAGVEPGDYHLTWRAVDPTHQRRGIGFALVNCRVEHALQLGCRAIHGHTEHRNYGTRRLLRSLDFAERDMSRSSQMAGRAHSGLRIPGTGTVPDVPDLPVLVLLWTTPSAH